MLQKLGPILPPNLSSLHSLYDVDKWTALSICRICQPEEEKSVFQSIDHCIVNWPCCWARCWMLQDMDHMEASWVFYVKVHTFVQLEQSKICILTVISFGIVTLTVQHDMIGSMCFVWDPGDVLRQTSPDVLSIDEFLFCMYQTWDISSCSLECVPENKQTKNIGPTYCKSRDGWSHPQLAAIRSRVILECASWLSFIPLWLVAYYIFLRTFHFSLSSSSPFPQQQVMAAQSPQPSGTQSEPSRTTGASSNVPLAVTQQQRSQQWVQRDATIGATENMAQDTH